MCSHSSSREYDSSDDSRDGCLCSFKIVGSLLFSTADAQLQHQHCLQRWSLVLGLAGVQNILCWWLRRCLRSKMACIAC
jgi:hypothetical protein